MSRFKVGDVLVFARPPGSGEDEAAPLQGAIVRVVATPARGSDLLYVLRIDGVWDTARGFFSSRFDRVDPGIAALYGVDSGHVSQEDT